MGEVVETKPALFGEVFFSFFFFFFNKVIWLDKE